MAVIEAAAPEKPKKQPPDDEKRRMKIVAGSLMKAVIRPGGGDSTPSDGDQVIYHCTVRTLDGVIVQSSRSEYGGKGIPIRSVLGKSKMIVGLLEGIPTMQKGEIAMLKMKPQVHYGEDDCPLSAPTDFPKDDELHFEIEMIDFFKAKDDFTLWRRRMKSVLILQDLYEAVLGIENKAVDMADKVWQKMDKKARSTIELHLADHVLGRVLDSGASYEQFITTLVSGKDSLKYDEITEAIQSFIKTSSKTESSQGGLQVKGKETSQLTSKEDKSGNKGTTKSKKKYKEGCFKCGVADHLKRNCKEGRMEAHVTAGSSSTANIVIRKDEDDCELLVVTSSSNAFRDWILDTGCTFHMCAIQEWFDTFEESSSGEVFRGDDSPGRIS
ncbi:hypothetical protein ACLB2K_065456 [Fragaria x ananassa]